MLPGAQNPEPLSLCRWQDAWGAKYQLACTVRTHMGADDDSFNCIKELDDKQGHHGVALQPSVTKVAQQAFRRNLARLGPLVLPYTELVWPSLTLCNSVISML